VNDVTLFKSYATLHPINKLTFVFHDKKLNSEKMNKEILLNKRPVGKPVLGNFIRLYGEVGTGVTANVTPHHE
jgi:hypothetical protein